MKKETMVMTTAFGIAALFLMTACAGIPNLHLTYQLPSGETASAGKNVFLTVEDIRNDPNTFGKGARQKLPKVSEDMALSIARGTDAILRKGIYSPPALLREAMESRLRHENVAVVPAGGNTPGLSLRLKTFQLDRLDQKWLFKLAYEARLIQGNRVVASEIVNGEAERFEMVGKEEAEVVLGEMLTETVNRLNLDTLFQKAGQP